MPTLLYLVWSVVIVNEHAQFGCQEISDTEDKTDKNSIKFLTFNVTLTLKRTTYFYTKHSSL